VGKAADHPPALVILSLNAEKKGAKSIVWVGKGIVYDTGGLSIKTKTGMPGRSWTH
jgi:probable aminopeptidase NPEPL1